MTDGHDSVAQSVLELLASAQQQVVIVSAFIRSETLDFLLSDVRQGVNIRVYARWRIADIAAGASDIAVIDVAERRRAEFRVYDALHAKIYIADDRALVGSANATDTGLGRHHYESNLEILIESPADCPEIRKVLDILNEKSQIPLRFPDECLMDVQHCPAVYIDRDAARSNDNWLPSSVPDAILRAGKGETPFDNNILQDCFVLGVGAEITENRLSEMVKGRRVFEVLNNTLSHGYLRGISDESVVSVLSESFQITPSAAAEKWDIVKEWVEKFSDDMYISHAGENSTELRLGQRIKFR